MPHSQALLSCLPIRRWARILVCAALLSCPAAAGTLFQYVGTDPSVDARPILTRDILRLALEKTKDSHGDYVLEPIVHHLNKARLLREIQRGEFATLFVRTSADDRLLEDFSLVPFPTALGADSYRVAFVGQGPGLDPRRFCELSEEQIKQKTVVQGIGWLDSDILAENQFRVVEVGDYSAMFELVGVGRVDMFYRSVFEIEIEQRYPLVTKNQLIAEPCWALYYPLPRFLLTSKANADNAQRILTGLQRAYEDGSYLKLWEGYYFDAVKSADLPNRKIIRLTNPFLQRIGDDYLQYFAVSDKYMIEKSSR